MDELQNIQNLIYEVRGVKVMLDKDLAELYHVTTGNLNKAVKRNIKRFPSDFMFPINKRGMGFSKIPNWNFRSWQGEMYPFVVLYHWSGRTTYW